MAGAQAARRGGNLTRHDRWTIERRTLFLESLAKHGVVAKAGRAAGKTPSACYKLRGREPAFAALWEEALEQHRDTLRAVAVERAVNGVERQVYYCGRLVGTQTEFSERLLLYLLQRRQPTSAPAERAEAAAAREQAAADAAALTERIDQLLAAKA